MKFLAFREKTFSLIIKNYKHKKSIKINDTRGNYLYVLVDQPQIFKLPAHATMNSSSLLDSNDRPARTDDIVEAIPEEAPTCNNNNENDEPPEQTEQTEQTPNNNNDETEPPEQTEQTEQIGRAHV